VNRGSFARFAFGAFEADTASGQLRKHGLRVRLDDKAWQVLLALVERPGELVSREELTHRLWADDVFVDFERNLNNAVSRLREVLGDSATSPHFVETVPRKGYRFIGTVRAIPAPSDETAGGAAVSSSRRLPSSADGEGLPPARRSLGLLLGVPVLAAVLAAVWASYAALQPEPTREYRSLVVLPFDGGGGDPEAAGHLAFALSEALTAELSRLQSLAVVSMTSARRYKDSGEPLSVIARALDVDAVIEGSVYREGEQLRVTVQLIDGASDRHLWAESYHRGLGGLLALQREVAQTIAREIHLRLTPQDESRLASRPTVAPEVQEALLQGQYYLSKGTDPDRELARRYFERVLALDPAHALAHTGLAGAYLLSDDLPPEEAMPRAQAHAARALELDRTIADAHAFLGFIRYYGDWDWAGAAHALQAALDLDPSNVRAIRWQARVIGATGRAEEALALTRRARQLDPVSLATLDSAAAEAFRARHFGRSREIAHRMVALDPVDERGYEYLAINSAMQRAFKECLEAAGRGAMLSEEAPHFLTIDTYCLGRLGQTAEAGQSWRRLEALAAERYVPPYFMAIAAIGMDRHEEAIGWLQRGFVERDAYMVELLTSPWLDPVRDDARVQRMLAVMAYPPIEVVRR
jgi:TolB-like protein/DNA-binding winged helix-turn-helix (wHTH) protein